MRLVFRRVLQPDDTVVLVGHSTGGLDIRCLLSRLQRHETMEPPSSDPTPDERPLRIDPTDVLRDAIAAGRVRAVFLSVPHLGTNIADFVGAHRSIIRVLLFFLKWFPWFVGFVISLIRVFGVVGRGQLVDEAIDDVRRELRIPSDDPWGAAEARRARAKLELWRTQTTSDFLAITDLAAARGADRLVDRARDGTARELDGVPCLTFATITPHPFVDDPVYDPHTRSIGDVRELARDAGEGTDELFRTSYAACAAGPFDRRASARWLPGCGYDEETSVAIEPWENDGIVNTASMIWPAGDTWLVPADHADIIGHYSLRPAKNTTSGRRHEAYNLLDSHSQFGPDQFRLVWHRVFEFSVRPAPATSQGRPRNLA